MEIKTPEAVAPRMFSFGANTNVKAKHEAGALFTVQNELGEDLSTQDESGNTVPFQILFSGIHSPTYVHADNLSRGKFLKRKGGDVTIEKIDESQLIVIASCAKSWNLRDNGVAVPCTTENVLAVLESAPWIGTDARKFVEDPARFLA